MRGAVVAACALAGIGVWLDRTHDLDQWALFVAFHVASLLGVVLAIARLWPRYTQPYLRLIVVVCSIIVWRVSYFPIMVFAGWTATLGEWALLQVNLPTIIYPTFLIFMALMHWVAITAGAYMIGGKKIYVAPALVSAFIIAVLVSFTSRDDLTLLPDHFFVLEQPLPRSKAPVDNPYLPVVSEPHYNVAERVLVFASGAMYALIPSTPWSTAVKGVLEHLFRDNPKASSAARVKEHYLAFRRAHDRIACTHDCAPGNSPIP